MAGKPPPIVIDGLKEARRDLRQLDRALAREFGKALKSGAEIVAADARRRAPKRTGRLAGSIRAGVSGNRAVIRSNVPYANPIHWGWPKRGIRANRFIEKAGQAKAEESLDRIADEMDRLFARVMGGR